MVACHIVQQLAFIVFDVLIKKSSSLEIWSSRRAAEHLISDLQLKLDTQL